MSVAHGSLSRFAFVPETTIGTIPTSPVWQIGRIVSEGIEIQKQMESSNEIRADRNAGPPVDVGRMVQGPINTELSYGSYDVWFEHLLASAWSTNVLKNGVLQKSMAIEKTFEQGTTDSYIRYTGCRIDTLDLQLAAKQRITANWGIMGITSPTPTTAILSGATYTPALTTEYFNSGINVGSFNMASTTLVSAPKIRSLAINIRNNTYPVDAVGSYYPVEHGLGQFLVSGTAEVLFESLAIYTAIVAHEDVALSFSLTDTAGNSYAISVPKTKLAGGGPVIGGNGQVVIVRAPFTAFFDSSSSASMTITRTPA